MTKTRPSAPVRRDADQLARTVIGRRSRLMELIALATQEVSAPPESDIESVIEAWVDPTLKERRLAALAGAPTRRVIVNGTVDERLLGVERTDGRWAFGSFGTLSLGELPLPAGAELERGAAFVSTATLDERAVLRLTRPRVHLAALCHPEVFPLPRFPLGISDLARAVRSRLLGRVTLSDMQLGLSLDEIVDSCLTGASDIIGISATFGQHDLLDAFLARLTRQPCNGRLIVVGGSLSALNKDLLLEQYPHIFVATGAGEATIQDLVSLWLGDIEVSEVRHVAHRQGGQARLTLRRAPRRFNNREYHDILPELDLLVPTLSSHGVMQLESSRGCTHACSFCPREHKGIWSGDDPEHLGKVLDDVSLIYERFPEISRKLFLVDEEFVGAHSTLDPVARCKDVAARVFDRGFRWESNARIDQVYHPERDREWHIDRMKFWSYLRDHGLARCLFGIESGVDSILRRFNKRTTSEQNVLGLRILTALGIPLRLTYITFDHLMSFEELLATYEFQGRTDLLMPHIADLSVGALFDAVHDEAFVRERGTGLPFHTHISYMLVSMECLIGSPYLHAVEQEGLARDHLPSMGRRNAEFRDPLIGLLSDFSQRWIDRNFSLDYTLKSLEKLSDGAELQAVRDIRFLLRQSAYGMFGRLLTLVKPVAAARAHLSTGRWLPTDRELRLLRASLRNVGDAEFAALTSAVVDRVEQESLLASDRRRKLREEIERWRGRTSWELINDHSAFGSSSSGPFNEQPYPRTHKVRAPRKWALAH